jgi:DnaJ-domain-containing protein 1
MTDGLEELAAMERTRPFAEAMFLVMAADGEVVEAEREVLRGAIRTLSGGLLGTAAVESMVRGFERDLAQAGADWRMDLVASELYGEKEDRELALALVGAMAAADRDVSAAERRVMQELAERLGASSAEVRAMLGEHPT